MPPINVLPPIPTPPDTTNAPEVIDVEAVVLFINVSPSIITLLKVDIPDTSNSFVILTFSRNINVGST